MLYSVSKISAHCAQIGQAGFAQLLRQQRLTSAMTQTRNDKIRIFFIYNNLTFRIYRFSCL